MLVVFHRKELKPYHARFLTQGQTVLDAIGNVAKFLSEVRKSNSEKLNEESEADQEDGQHIIW